MSLDLVKFKINLITVMKISCYFKILYQNISITFFYNTKFHDTGYYNTSQHTVPTLLNITANIICPFNLRHSVS